jgi:hypothetical protein
MANKFVVNKAMLLTLKKVHKKSLLLAWEWLSNKLKEAVAKDTSDHARSITVEMKWENRVDVGSARPQALIEEKWRRPWKRPNLNALVWRAGRHGFHQASKTASYDSLPSEAKGKVFILARSIKKKWIKAKWTYTKVYEKNIKFIQNLYSKSFKRWIT